MKKHSFIYAFILALLTMAISCKKDTEVNKNTFKIAHEEVIATTQSVKITGSYDYAGTIDGITLELGRQSDLMDADAYRTLLEDTDFSVEVKNLRPNTTYYYRYSVEYGGKTPYFTEIKRFKTQEYNLPEVKSKEVVSVGVNRAEVSGEVISDGGGDAVTLRGICWSMSHNPSVGDEYTNAGEGIGLFTCELTNLQPEKTYYARAFAGNSKGVSYGEELTFVTMAAGSLAEVHTIGITGNVMLQATVSGEVTDEGTSAVLERGVCYGKEHYPTTNGLHVSSGSGMGEYSCQLMNLEANVTYYVRAYAINSMGIAYGEEMSFVAQTEETTPVVHTGMVSDITVSSATGHGTVVSDGGATVTRRGLCWSTSHNPTIDDTHADCGNGVGVFSGLMPRLMDLTTYYVRAYAENAIGMAYGEEVSFTVGEHDQTMPPTVTTSEVINISSTTAVGGGNVINDGGAEVTERGICWNTSSNPSVDDNHASNGMGMGSYTCMMTGLAPGTLYYVKAYAVNDYGLSYGDQMEFITEAALPTIILDEASGATISYSVTNDGGAEVVEHGVCYGTSHGPTVSGDHVSGGSGTGSFTVELTGLQPGTTYYWCLYATNNIGTAYGTEYTLDMDANLPTVTTFEVMNITTTTAMGGGEVTYDGGATVTERGICWGTSHDPNISGSHASNGTGLGDFTCNMTGLTPNTEYYVRAYAKNSAGTAYGDEVRFITADLPLYTINVSADPDNGGTVSGGGTYQQGQQCTVTAIANNDYTFANWTENGGVVSTNASYTFIVTGDRSLVANFNYSDPGDTFFVDFESGLPAGWTTIDADGDGYNWTLGSIAFQGEVNGHNGSSDMECSSSYNNILVLYPDNYLVSPQVTLAVGSTFSFYACTQDVSYPEEHFGVFVSENGTSNWTMIQEWTMTAKGGSGKAGRSRDGNTREQGVWYPYSVDLSAYAGQRVHIAIRHFNCFDQFYLDVDDIELSNAKK
jgi:hypothetical protein